MEIERSFAGGRKRENKRFIKFRNRDRQEQKQNLAASKGRGSQSPFPFVTFVFPVLRIFVKFID